jgi:hypothetical protein
LASADIAAVELRDGSLGFCVIGHFNKSKPARTTGFSIVHQAGAGNLPTLGEHLVQLIFCCVKRQTSYEQLRHKGPLWA